MFLAAVLEPTARRILGVHHLNSLMATHLDISIQEEVILAGRVPCMGTLGQRGAQMELLLRGSLVAHAIIILKIIVASVASE